MLRVLTKGAEQEDATSAFDWIRCPAGAVLALSPLSIRHLKKACKGARKESAKTPQRRQLGFFRIDPEVSVDDRKDASSDSSGLILRLVLTTSPWSPPRVCGHEKISCQHAC